MKVLSIKSAGARAIIFFEELHIATRKPDDHAILWTTPKPTWGTPGAESRLQPAQCTARKILTEIKQKFCGILGHFCDLSIIILMLTLNFLYTISDLANLKYHGHLIEKLGTYGYL